MTNVVVNCAITDPREIRELVGAQHTVTETATAQGLNVQAAGPVEGQDPDYVRSQLVIASKEEAMTFVTRLTRVIHPFFGIHIDTSDEGVVVTIRQKDVEAKSRPTEELVGVNVRLQVANIESASDLVGMKDHIRDMARLLGARITPANHDTKLESTMLVDVAFSSLIPFETAVRRAVRPGYAVSVAHGPTMTMLIAPLPQDALVPQG